MATQKNGAAPGGHPSSAQYAKNVADFLAELGHVFELT
jgi:hypothetical protein